MAFLIGSSSISAYTTNTAISNNSNYANYCGTTALSVTPSASGTATKLNLYIAGYTTIANIKVVLYENGTLLSQATYNLAAIGNGFVTLNFPSTAINSANKYRLAFYMDNAGTLNLWTKSGGLDLRREIIGTYTTPSATIGDGTYRSNSEFYWSLETAPAYSIDDIDSGDSVEVGQTFSVNTTGFTGQPTATTNNANVSVTITGGAANVWAATVTNRQDNTTLGLLPITPIQLTLTNGGETANRNFTLTKQSDDILVTFTGANTSDPTYITTALAGLGYTVEGAGFWYKVPVGMSDLLVLPTGVVDVTNTGTFTAWFRPTSGLGSGKYYYFDVTVTEGGVVIVTLTRNNYYIGFGISI